MKKIKIKKINYMVNTKSKIWFQDGDVEDTKNIKGPLVCLAAKIQAMLFF